MKIMKYIFEFVLITIVLFFVWNILKRIFFNKFYKYTGFKPQNNTNRPEEKNSEKKDKSQKLNWDAETVDYEEVSETKNKS